MAKAILFTGGSVFDGTAFLAPGTSVLVSGGRVTAVGTGLDAGGADIVVLDRPAFLQNCDGHGGWVNSKALELAGITRDTLDPADGRIERDATGDPVGMLQEGAMALVRRLIPRTPTTTGTAGCTPPRTTCCRSASPAGRTRSSAAGSSRTTLPAPTGGRPARGRCARTWSERCGGAGTRASSSCRSCCTGARTTAGTASG